MMQQFVPQDPIARSAAGLFRTHIRMLEVMAAHCERLLATTSSDPDELRAAAASYREMAARLRDIVGTDTALKAA
jgi:hypothetical protein